MSGCVSARGSLRRAWLCASLVVLLNVSAWCVRQERDDTGQMVALPDQVHRLVSLAPSLTNTVYALGASAQLVGITNYTVFPPEAAKEKPSVGDVVHPSLEKIVALHPDLVIALPDFSGAETIAGLQRLGIPVFLFSTGGVSHIYQTVATLGRILGREPQATALLAKLHSRENQVREQTANQARPSVLLVLAVDPLITAGRNAFITEMIAAAGARSVTDDFTQDWLQTSIEAILPRKPDFILVMNDGPVRLKDMQQRAGWTSLEAVRRGRVIIADDRIQLPSPAAFDGLEDLARQLRAMQGH